MLVTNSQQQQQTNRQANKHPTLVCISLKQTGESEEQEEEEEEAKKERRRRRSKGENDTNVMCGSRFLWLFSFSSSQTPQRPTSGERQPLEGDKRFKRGFERVTVLRSGDSILSGGGSNPRRRSSSHSEASRLNSRQISKQQKEWRKKESGRLRLEAFSSMSAQRFRSERRRR